MQKTTLPPLGNAKNVVPNSNPKLWLLERNPLAVRLRKRLVDHGSAAVKDVVGFCLRLWIGVLTRAYTYHRGSSDSVS